MNRTQQTRQSYLWPALGLAAGFALSIQCLPLDLAGQPEDEATALLAGFVGTQGLRPGSGTSGLRDGTVSFGP